MNKFRIISLVLLVVALGMGYYLYASIRGPIEENRRIAAIEARVIDKLKVIQEAQLAYFAVNGRYAKNFDQLKDFIYEGEFTYIVRRERILDVKNYLGQDSIEVKFDTLGTTAVRDSLFTEAKYPDLNIDRLEKVPGSGKDFIIYAGQIRRPNGFLLEVMEVKDPAPANPNRIEGGRLEPLKIGSRTEVTTSGNWK